MRFLPLIAVLLLFTACAQTLPPTVTVQEPAAPAPIETAPEPVPEEPVAPETPPFVEANEGVTFGGAITRVICDREERSLTFTFTNPTQFTLHLDKDLPWPSPKGQAVVGFSINGVDMNSGVERRFDDELLFGELPFSSHCGTALVEPGASATCTVRPVPFKAKTGTIDASTNDLSMNTQGVYEVVTFLC